MSLLNSDENLFTRHERRRKNIAKLQNSAMAIFMAVTFFGLLSLTKNEPETPPTIHYVDDTVIARCMPHNDAMLSILKVRYGKDGKPYIACEMHEPMGYGMVPPKAIHIKVAVNSQVQR